jgi:uncharacterized protein (TIGR02597 family)
MKTYIPYSLILAAASAGMAFGAETAYTTPVGYVTQTCLPGSDTIVGVPLRLPTVAAAALTSAPTSGPTNAVLTVTGAAFGAFGGTHYVKFTSGANAGAIFAITSNDATTITIDRNGATLTATTGDKFSVTKFWTLAELFDPAVSTNDPATTGNAIVLSNLATGVNRRTEVLLPDTTTANINLSASATYYILKGVSPAPNQWRKQGGSTDAGGLQLWPDNYLTIRNPTTVTASTKFTNSGEVDTTKTLITLFTRVGAATEKRDNPKVITRPVDVTLNGLNLAQTSAFITSTSPTGVNRRDELIVFDNTTAALNKSAFKTYYFLGGAVNQWRLQGGSTDAGPDVIPAGSGFVIRKYGTAGGETVFWNNTPTY